MKVIFEYDPVSGMISGANNVTACMPGMTGFDPEPDNAATTIELVKQGITVDEILKLKNNDLL